MRTGKRDIIASLISSFDYESISSDNDKLEIATNPEGWMIFKRDKPRKVVEVYLFHEFLHGDFMRSNVIKLFFWPSGTYFPDSELPQIVEWFAIHICKQYKAILEAEKQKHIKFKSEVKNIMDSWFRLCDFFEKRSISFPTHPKDVERFMNKLQREQPDVYSELEDQISREDKATDDYINSFGGIKQA